MSRSSRIVGLLVLLAALGWTGAAQPQARKAKVEPHFEAVAETQLLMIGLLEPNYRALDRFTAGRLPADLEPWLFARGQALLVAESGNLLLLRPPRTSGQDTWQELAMQLRSDATALARHFAGKDLPRSKAALTQLRGTCVKCHETFRVPVKFDGRE